MSPVKGLGILVLTMGWLSPRGLMADANESCRYDRGYFPCVNFYQRDPRGDSSPDPVAQHAKPKPNQLHQRIATLNKYHPIIQRMVAFYLDGDHPYTWCRAVVLKNQWVSAEFIKTPNAHYSEVSLDPEYAVDRLNVGEFIPADRPDIRLVFKTDEAHPTLQETLRRKIAAEFVLSMLFAPQDLKKEIVASFAPEASGVRDERVKGYFQMTWQTHNLGVVAQYLRDPIDFERSAQNVGGGKLFLEVLHATQ